MDLASHFQEDQDLTILDLARRINGSPWEAALFVSSQKLVGIATDGDLRRALSDGCEPLDPAHPIISRFPHVVDISSTREQALLTMERFRIRHLPIVDDGFNLLGIHTMSQSFRFDSPSIEVVVAAGGLGTRLLPLTETTPKPLVKIAGVSVIDRLIRSLLALNVSSATFLVDHFGELLESHISQRPTPFRLNFVYDDEDTLATGTACRRFFEKHPNINDTIFLVVNADTFFDFDLHDLVFTHAQAEMDLTVATTLLNTELPYGALDRDRNPPLFVEKPRLSTEINLGAYVFSRKAVEYFVTSDLDSIPELYNSLRVDGGNATTFEVRREWSDIGNIRDLARANGLL